MEQEDLNLPGPLSGESGLNGLTLPVFFYLNSGPSIVAIPISNDEKGEIVSFPYRVEAGKDKDGLFTKLKVFHPRPLIRLRTSSICYDAEVPASIERRYLGHLISEKRRILQAILHHYGMDPEQHVDFYKRRLIELEGK